MVGSSEDPRGIFIDQNNCDGRETIMNSIYTMRAKKVVSVY